MLITKTEHLAARLAEYPWSVVVDAVATRKDIEDGRVASARQSLADRGFIELPEHEGGQLLQDGREVIMAAGSAWALRPEVHAQRAAEALKSKQAPETKSVAGTESLAALVCPKCGDSLQHTRVCPACAAGKLGYRHRYTCVCGGVDLVSREAL